MGAVIAGQMGYPTPMKSLFATRLLAPLRRAVPADNAGNSPAAQAPGTPPADDISDDVGDYVLAHHGVCPICENETRFTSKFEWFRDHLRCGHCGTIPRERALMMVIDQLTPQWRSLMIHESSPGLRSATDTHGVSGKLRSQNEAYSWSHYFEDVTPGDLHAESGERCENLEALTFADATFDLFITQDVMEHVFDPARAFREIARVLKPGGRHIFTVPMVNKDKPSVTRATRSAHGTVTHHLEPAYHDNPVDPKGSLVTRDWGFDLASFIMTETQCPTIIIQMDNLDRGIRAEFIEVVVTTKPA
ncbi:MAG: class I SAM-dependent methyltransferase [Pseudomonadota bacterium]